MNSESKTLPPLKLYEDMSQSDKEDLLYNKCGILNGMGVQDTGNAASFVRTAKPVCEQPAEPAAGTEPKLKESESIYIAFSEFADASNRHGTDAVGLHLIDTGNNDGEYFLARQVFPKVTVAVDINSVNPAKQFVKAIQDAVNIGDSQGYGSLLQALIDYGTYFPTKVTLGGALIASCSNFAMPDSPAARFGSVVNTTYGVFGTGGTFYEGNPIELITTVPELNAIGGDPAKSSHPLDAWVKSLVTAASWRVISSESFVPTLAVLANYNQDLLGDVDSLIKHQINSKQTADPHVNMGRYDQALQEYLNIM